MNRYCEQHIKIVLVQTHNRYNHNTLYNFVIFFFEHIAPKNEKERLAGWMVCGRINICCCFYCQSHLSIFLVLILLARGKKDTIGTSCLTPVISDVPKLEIKREKKSRQKPQKNSFCLHVLTACR